MSVGGIVNPAPRPSHSEEKLESSTVRRERRREQKPLGQVNQFEGVGWTRVYFWSRRWEGAGMRPIFQRSVRPPFAIIEVLR
jgi:hypothetical protein